MTVIYVDADGCPVKNEVYRVAARYGLPVTLVANARFHVPERDGVELVLVERDPEAADDWIAGRASDRDIVVTADIPLAARCVKNGARVLNPKGKVYREASMGDVLAQRDLMAGLRDAGVMTGGPSPFSAADRSRFLQRLDALVHELRGKGRRGK